MSRPQWAHSDDALLAELREALTTVPEVSDRVAVAARGSFAWQSVDEDLALLTLVGDSSQEVTTGVRGGPGDLRLLEFQSDQLSLEVEMNRGFVIGQLIPMQAGHITLSTAEGTFSETDADATGSFRLARPGSGPVRMVCRTSSAHLATEWTSL